jgi:hypothetical protein
MPRMLGLCIAVIVGLVMMISAAFMLASPRSWFRLPAWLRARGSLTENKYASGWGAVQVRLTGAGILGIIVWLCITCF